MRPSYDRLALALLPLVVAACYDTDDLSYDWDDRRAVCSEAMDDMTGTAPDWDRADAQLDASKETGDVSLFHMHDPGSTVSVDEITRMLDSADARELDYVTYNELVPGPKHGSLALAFDDTDIDGWYALRDLFAAHGARVTFFITEWDTIGDAQRAELQELYAAGHDVEPHTISHLHAPDYVAANGLDAYLANEVLPSIAQMRDAGYPPTSLAFPYGETTPEITAAVLEHIDRVRIGPGTCPNRH